MATNLEQENTRVNLPDIITIDPNSPVSIEKYLEQCDLVHNDTAIIRERLIQKVGAAVANIEFDFNGNSLDDSTKKIMAVETLSKLIDAREKSMTNRVNLRLKNKEVKGNEAIGKMAAELLTKIDLSIKGPSQNKPIPKDALDELDKALSDLDIKIATDECRKDPYDFTGLHDDDDE